MKHIPREQGPEEKAEGREQTGRTRGNFPGQSNSLTWSPDSSGPSWGYWVPPMGLLLYEWDIGSRKAKFTSLAMALPVPESPERFQPWL